MSEDWGMRLNDNLAALADWMPANTVTDIITLPNMANDEKITHATVVDGRIIIKTTRRELEYVRGQVREL